MELLVLFSLLFCIYEAYADYCGENKFCHSPYKCCESRQECCYDNVLHNNQLFRYQIWNMWYFWLLIIFMLMSCFGGCGYYRQRRLALMSRSSSLTRPDPVLPAPCHRSTRRSRSQEGNRQFNFFAYNGPGYNGPEPVSNLPPAYYEVVNQPSLYPANKIELPPYPGVTKTEDSQMVYSAHRLTGAPSLDASLPPPYTESQCNSSLPPSSQSQNTYHEAFNSNLQVSAGLPPASATSGRQEPSSENANNSRVRP